MLLAPLGWVFRGAVALRRAAYRARVVPPVHPGVPVIVVGNITVGGTGKTPLVIALVELLRGAGYKPAVVSRGYGGSARRWPQQVRPDSDPYTVGDEAVVIARRGRCPMAVGPDRIAAARALVEQGDCNIIVSDDGLQHYALARDVEIAVIDGVRRLGNGRCLPAGPLREPAGRLATVDYVVANGAALSGEIPMKLTPGDVRSVQDPSLSEPLQALRGERVHAVAGIGNPERFFRQLEGLGMTVVPHPFPDHHRYQPADLDFAGDEPVIMTEKDAVKWRRYARGNHGYLPVTAELPPSFTKDLLERVKSLMHNK